VRPRRSTLGGLLAAVAIAGVVLVLALRPATGAARVKGMIAWPGDCADVATTHGTAKRWWPHAKETATIECEYLGPAVVYARFANRADLRRDLLRTPPASPVCIAGNEVVTDDLDPGQFPPLCRKLGGDRIDAVSKLPEIDPTAPTGAATDRAVAAEDRRDTAAQARALRAYWAR
jgi:hypothetical protein